MVSGTGISSNGAQGAAEQYPQDVIPEEEPIFSDESSESDIDVDVPRVGRRRIGVRDDRTRARRRFAKAELDRNLVMLRRMLQERTIGTTSAAPAPAARPVIPVLPRVVYPVEELANMHINSLQRAFHGVLTGMQLPRTSLIEGFSRDNPIVKVLRENGYLNLKITCAIRSRLLLDLLAFLEQKSLNLLDGSSIVNLENCFYANLHLEMFKPETPAEPAAEPAAEACSEPRPEPRPEPLPLPLPEIEDDEALKQEVIRLVRQVTPASTSNNAN